MRLLLLLLTLIPLASCTTISRQDQAPAQEARWQQHLAALQTLEQWTASGRIAVKTTDDGGNVRLWWRKTPGRALLRLSAPLGKGVLKLVEQGDRFLLHTPDGNTLESSNPDSMLLDYTGWHIPVRELRHWMTGQPGTATDYQIDDFGRLASLGWRDWTVKFERYSQDIHPALPTKMVASKESVRIRVVIDDWNHQRAQINSERIPLPEGNE